MEQIEQTVKLFLAKYALDNPEKTYLVAFSGGFDSMCLLHALRRICDNKIVALHLNHNWRGEESDREEQNCANFCSKIGVDFYSEKLDASVPHTETAARNARYEFFNKCSQKFKSDIIFTAHNKNDNAETLIYRIAHGTGIKGLQGIAPKRDFFYRPLLSVERKNIEAYCANHNLSPNNDSSNSDTNYNRNFIRHKILPELSKINSHALDNINSLSLCARDDTEIINEYLNLIKNKIFEDNKYNLKSFLNLSEPVQMRILYELVVPLFPQDYDKKRISVLLDFIKNNNCSKSGKVCSVTTNCNLFVSDKYFELVKNEPALNISIYINKTGEYFQNSIKVKITECDKKPENTSSEILYADLSGVDFDFIVRTRHDGDIIQPLGMSGHQKLKKYLNSKKIPNHEKDRLIMLTQGKEVLWIAGVGLSDKIKVKTKPTHKIEIYKE
ncbi:MAG: tRNA lysidine(34) synthetase TilS [Cyanobacteriota bacterium]|nr:tRNA lysidine(34) synthetase TilS [Cyanobacteriota bacterium]MDY6359433.1 tRNA lysidine(34) synthetase TilS [Cyanobacteriota bacterium]MDY6382621.1 tRNA lysidine(34) synthetase TilS [Cyanobacteriota bacterium]